MSNLKEYNLGFFLTRGMSLGQWEKIGILEREIAVYRKLAGEYKELYVFSYGLKKDAKYSRLFPDNVKVVYRPFYIPVLAYSFLLPFIHKTICKKLHVLKTNQMDGSTTAVLVKKMYGAKLVIRCGYEWLSYLESTNASFIKKAIAFWVESYAYKNADKILISSEPSKHFIKERFHVRESDIIVLPNAIDTVHFHPSVEKKIPHRIAFVGRLEHVKNVEMLVRALVGLDAKLVVIGEGSLKSELQKVASDISVDVEWKGVVSQKDLPLELQKSDIFVLPSFSEGNPKSLLEAMSCGLACVGTRVPGIEAVIDNGVNGITCELNTESLRESIEMLLKNDDIKKQIGVEARKTIEERYSLDTIFEKEITLYDQILRYTK